MAITMSSNNKRKLRELQNGDRTEPPAKRTGVQTQSREKSSIQDTENSGKDAAEVSLPPGISQKHPVNIQNGIYAAERLSCSLEITHSINFILLGEIYP